ncbi:MAG: hypothetical protein KatS3mg131_0407 [Candidatus Tectimicrobiota bacterium]|nr:MAG: hypothetical protein KatS3mg131_0407 [Candidatus Tectomicrobia bacterium]
MRLRKEMIEYIARQITANLVDKGLVALSVPAEKLAAELRRLITEDLLVEDRLNEEVKAILRAHAAEMDRHNVDYARMFAMVKRQLIKERGLIL